MKTARISLVPPLRFRYAACLFVALLFTTNADADPESADFDRLLDLSLADAPVLEVLQSFASVTGVELRAPEDVQGEVTLELDDVPIRQALHQTCRLRALRCELLPGSDSEPGRLWVRDNRGRRDVPSGFFETLTFSLFGAGGREVLEAFSRVAGRPLHIEPGELAPIRLELRHAPWPVALSEICDLAGCEITWSPTWRVTPGAPASERRRSLALDGAPLEDVLRSLINDPIWGPLGPLRLEIPAELAAEARTPVSVEVEAAPWPELLAAVCEPVGLTCGVRYGDPGVLEVRRATRTREAAVGSGIEPPPPSTAGINLGLRWTRGGRLLADEPVALDWEHPSAELTDGEGGRLRVVWIPFEPGFQELLPLAYRCDRTEVTVLPLLTLPPGPDSKSVEGLQELRIEAVAEPAERASSPPPVAACAATDGVPLEVTLGPRPAGDPPSSPRLSLEARVGALLLLVSADRRDPAAALVSLGDDSRGWRRLALLRPGAPDDATTSTGLEQLAIAPGSTLEILLESTDDVLSLTLPDS